MRESGLCAVQPRTRRYNSYMGEISPAVNNVIGRDFHAVLVKEFCNILG